MKRKVKDRMTPQRRAWLQQLVKKPSVAVGRGSAAYYCRVLGWTAWIDHDRNLEVITDEGRRALNQGPRRP